MPHISFLVDNTFHELNKDLEIEANEWHLNNFYINFDNEKQDEVFNQSSTYSQQILTDRSKLSKDANCEFFYKIPDYLLTSNVTFLATFLPELCSYFNPIDFQDLQELCYLTHQMSIIHLHAQLWHRILQSGTGQIQQRVQSFTSSSSSLSLIRSNSFDLTLSIWPEMVTSLMRSKGIFTDIDREAEIDQNIYINFVQNYLHQLDKKLKQCRLQFDSIRSRLPENYADAFYTKIDNFIQKEGLITMRLHYRARIALIEYTSIDRFYQLEYLQQKPTTLQLEAAKHIGYLTFDKEKASQELVLLKVDMPYNKLPKLLDLLEDSIPLTIKTIVDPILCQQISNEYRRIIQQTKADVLVVLIKAAEINKSACQKKIDKEIAELWKNQHRLLIDDQLTTTMVTLIEKRQKNTIECVKSIYDLKSDFFLTASTAPSQVTS